ncbi:MAG: helix-turn-helix transcriptional regulator [Methylococcales bacterium]|nr:helix-turn-helix transcriptional regulator [Methylococcales bacterium]
MVDNSDVDVEIQTALLDSGTEKVEILCDFKFDNHDCLAIKLADESDIPVELSVLDCNSLTEIARFKVNDCSCAIVMKVPIRETDEINLSIVLTARELQIATLVALGCPNKQVADKLHISEWTVATYMRRICAKLGVHTRAAMTYRCASLICKQDIVLTK